MSASTKKKLRKEQEAAMLTERQQAEKAKAKKLKRNTIIFVSIIALIVVAFVGLVVYRWITNNGIFEKATTAAEIGGKEFDSVEFNYYYNDTVMESYSDWYSNASSYAEMAGASVEETIMMLYNVDPTKPLNEQYVDQEGTQTWYDYFLNEALAKAQEDMALVNAAKKAGFTLPESEKEILHNQEHNLDAYAQIYGFTSVKGYLSGTYGNGADVDTYMEYLERQALADAYLAHYTEELGEKIYTDDEIAGIDSEDANKYTSHTYNYVYLSYTAFREENEDGSTTYTDEQNDAAREAAKKAAEALTSATTVEEFDEAIAALELSTTSSTAQKNQLHSAVSIGVIADWLAEGGHNEGDIVVLANESTSTDADGNETKTVNGYYVVRFGSTTDNKTPLNNIRHLLVSFDPDDAGIEVTDELKAEKLAKAEELLAEWKAGEATEASFETLVREHSDDNADEGGLYTNVGAHTNFVEPFLNWCIDEARQVGDCEIVESEYGYHIMYYCGQTEYTYREHLAMEDLRAAELEGWQTAQIAATTATLENTKYMNPEVLSGEG
ncbi:MAG: hypothetical protein E7437_08225 [Ruminococcaceae bacterium]|nr:hypothetical protein [Oscillospiraceae bacterium]